MIDPVAHALAERLASNDKTCDHKSIGYLEYFYYANAALEFLREKGHLNVF